MKPGKQINNNKNSTQTAAAATTTTTRRGRDACTIFIRNISPSLTRLELEEYFSEIGPVRKCSLISDSSKQQHRQQEQDNDDGQKKQRYGFVKFCNEQDASRAVQEHNKSKNNNNNNMLFTAMILEHADSNVNKSKTKKKVVEEEKTVPLEVDKEQLLAIQQKQTARVIVRNLSFYATDAHVRKAMSQFGNIVDVHLPMVPLLPSSSEKQKQQQQHRGFVFVTFENSNQAQKAVSSKDLTIKNRPVIVELSMSKHHHQQKQQQLNTTKNTKKQHEEQNVDEDNHSTNTANTSSDNDDDEDDDDDDDDGDDSSTEVSNSCSTSSIAPMEEDNPDQEQEAEENNTTITAATSAAAAAAKSVTENHTDDVKEQRTLFVRNIPFDANRHSLFLLFKQFGKLEAIFLVKDKVTQVCKGTAFIKFATKEACARALKKAGQAREDAPFIINSTEEEQEEGVFFQGRRLLVDLALDKQQASTLVAERDPETGQVVKKQLGKDRRNLYLKQEGHIPTNTLLWESLPTVDQEKRQRASSEKSTKLKSPIFFINPLRLSIRNLGKHVTKKGLKELAVLCTQEGLRKGLVTTMDVTAQLRAQGTLSPRECVSEEFCCIPVFDTQNIKKYVPSVFVNCTADNDSNKKDKTKAPSTSTIATTTSKGFGFIEFTYHAHALACLRELNNNVKYSKEWAFKGKTITSNQRSGGNNKKRKTESDNANDANKASRIIVEFTVENKVKAKQQADRRAHLLNPKTTSAAGEELYDVADDDEAKSMMKKKKGRGSITREKKRKRREEDNAGIIDDILSTAVDTTRKQTRISSRKEVEEIVRPVLMMKKPSKKRKIDKEEAALDQIVKKHQSTASMIAIKSSFADTSTTIEKGTIKKRWFE